MKNRIPRKLKKKIRKESIKNLTQDGYTIQVFGFTINEFEYN